MGSGRHGRGRKAGVEKEKTKKRRRTGAVTMRKTATMSGGKRIKATREKNNRVGTDARGESGRCDREDEEMVKREKIKRVKGTCG